MPDGWNALTCEACGGTLKIAGAQFGYMLSTEAFLSEAEIERIFYRFDEMAKAPMLHRPIILDGSMEVKELKHPLGGILRCENCGMLYEREGEPEQEARLLLVAHGAYGRGGHPWIGCKSRSPLEEDTASSILAH